MSRRWPGRLTVLAGGVGAARLLRGLAEAVPATGITTIVNTGDDDVFHGLYVSPDIDTVLYTLGGLVDATRGWGLRGDTFACLDALASHGVETWFRLGDRDLATHILRTSRLGAGWPLSRITEEQRRALGVTVRVLPMTDDPVRTVIRTAGGQRSFQEYLVRDRARETVREIRYVGARTARPAPGVLKAIEEADLIVVAPSNPLVSIAPILAIPGLRTALRRASVPVVAMSPLIGGRPVKGPADRMMRALGMKPTPLAIADQYADFLDGLLIDQVDRAYLARLEARGFAAAATDSLMRSPVRSAAVARKIVELGRSVTRHARVAV